MATPPPIYGVLISRLFPSDPLSLQASSPGLMIGHLITTALELYSVGSGTHLHSILAERSTPRKEKVPAITTLH